MPPERVASGALAPQPLSAYLMQQFRQLLLPGWRRAFATVSMLGFATIIGTGIVFATLTLLARELGPADYGLFTSSLATVTMIAPLAGFGLTQFRLKVYGVEGWAAHRWMRPSLRFTLVTTLLAAGSVILWALIGAPNDETRFDLLALSPVILSVLAIDLVSSKLRLEDRYAAMAVWMSLMLPVSRFLVVLALLLVPHLSPRFLPLSYGAISLVIVLMALPQLRILMRDEIKLRGHGPRPVAPAPVAPGMSELWSQTWAYGVYAALYPIFFQISTILLKYLDGDAQAGMYSIGLAVMTAIYLIPTTIYQKFLIAKLHRWAVHDRPKFWLVYRQGSFGMLLLGLVIGAALATLSPFMVPIVFGQSYRGVIPILMVLALCPPLRFLSTGMGAVLLTEDYMRFRVYAIAVATLFVVVLNVVLIPHYTGVGAAWATVAGELVLLLGTWIGVRRFRATERAAQPMLDRSITQ
jgi:O-antigen/teichoic acid export membrane protein